MEKNYRFKYQSSKKASEAIHRFQYYKEDMIPVYFPGSEQTKQANNKSLKCALGKNNLVYYWGQNFLDGETYVNQQSIIHSIKSTHLEKGNDIDQIFKINERSFQKISKVCGGMLAAGWNASEVVQFVLRSGDHQKGRKITFQLYIIHHCQSTLVEQQTKQLKWLHYVEKYSFAPQGIFYETVAVINHQSSMFGIYNNHKTFEGFIRKYYKFQKFQGKLLQYQDSIKQKIKQSEDPAFSEQHKLIKQIPSQFLKMFHTLKKQFGEDNQQLICRFMIARDFKLEETRSSIKQYLQWHKDITAKYKWEDFDDLHKMNMFYYLGQDYKGRPVILNKAKNVMVDKIDADKYCLYYMYFLQIQMVKKMRGYVTQLNIIADVQGIGNCNFKFAITKRNIQEGKKYCAQRQFKFFAVNISSFAHFCYRFIKPLLPKKTEQKVYVGGNNTKQIFENLNKDMSQDVIPTYLGGKNPLL